MDTYTYAPLAVRVCVEVTGDAGHGQYACVTVSSASGGTPKFVDVVGAERPVAAPLARSGPFSEEDSLHIGGTSVLTRTR